MRKEYSSPEAEIEKFSFNAVFTASFDDTDVDPIDPGVEDGGNDFDF